MIKYQKRKKEKKSNSDSDSVATDISLQLNYARKHSKHRSVQWSTFLFFTKVHCCRVPLKMFLININSWINSDRAVNSVS